MRYPIQAHQGKKTKILGYGLPAPGATTTEGHTFTNIENTLVEVEEIPKEVEKKAYNDIFLDKIILRAFVLYQLSLNLIDLPLAHPKLIDWDQPSVVYVDEFSTEHVLLKFMGEKMPHK